MQNELKEKRTKHYALMRSIADYSMALLYLAGSCFVFFPEKIGFSLQNFDKPFRYIFGSILALYGGWRIYRGYKKDYF